MSCSFCGVCPADWKASVGTGDEKASIGTVMKARVGTANSKLKQRLHVVNAVSGACCGDGPY